jgi:hypothetical protein
MAIDFDGTNDYVTFGAQTALNTSTFSVSVWVRPESYVGADNAGGRIVTKEANTGLDDGWGIAVDTQFSGVLTFRSEWSNASALWSCALALNVWSHVVVTYVFTSTANDPVMYVNGVSVTVTERVAPSGTAAVGVNALVVGARGTSGAGEFNGQIEDLQFFNVVLNAQQVAELYAKQGLPGHVTPEANVLLRARMNEGVTGSSVRDSSLSGFHGTASGSPVYAEGILRHTSPVL